jgi:hypothetical protein
MGRKGSRGATFVALLLAILALAVPGAAFAQTAPNPPDWGAAATAVVNGIIPIVATVLPLCVGLMALFMGPRIIKSLVSRFAK